MTTKTILTICRFVALLGGIGYAIFCGGHLLTFVSSFINLEWSKHTYLADPAFFNIRQQSVVYFGVAMILTIAATGMKAFAWYVVYDLLTRLKIQMPFSVEVQKRISGIAFILLGVWLAGSFFWKTYIHYLFTDTGIRLPENSNSDEYLFMAGIVYIISQVFKRGIELQAENDLTV